MSSNVMFEGDHVSKSIDEALSASENRGAKKGRDHFLSIEPVCRRCLLFTRVSRWGIFRV
ncbi:MULTISPECIES: hypothetical protein [unclassified Bradyrhizobium]|uniref:hypothetical protein n=1 Tax=unclassified Bradyrhizobium TaxID=2631580 RepID=UPI002304FA17|nr:MULTISPECIES: hypothetical protein [unclassified Bradyrhizobium]MDA9457531.1 hypothetical protein [Bradyrhizobium sp. CCBAU 21359]MDA9518999.1 hypothetical protein [Bradyrhizobium sp. CCBAU 11434]